MLEEFWAEVFIRDLHGALGIEISVEGEGE